MQLREYQKEALNEVVGAKEPNVCLFAPTAFGKSVIISELSKYYESQNIQVVILTNITKLIEQLSHHLNQYKLKHNIVKAGMEQEIEGANIHLIMQQTAHARKIGNEFKRCILIQDEYHISYGTPSYIELIKRLEPIKTIGLSATPIDADGMKLKDTHIIKTIDVPELTQMGFLTPIKTYIGSFAEKMDFSDVDIIKGGDYNEVQLAKVINTPAYNKQVVEGWKQLASDKKTIVFATGIKHCEALALEFKMSGFAVGYVHSKMSQKENDLVFQKFKTNEIQILVSISMISTGFDAPDVECAVMCRPTQSLRLYLQMVGRIMRIAENKTLALWLDFAQCTSTHGLYDEPLALTDSVELNKKIKENRQISGIKLLTDDNNLIEVESKEQLLLQIQEAKRKIGTNLKGLVSIFDASIDLRELVDLAFEFDNRIKGIQNTQRNIDFVYDKWHNAFELYPYKRNAWTKAFKTRAKNILRDKKKIVSLGYFIDFLIENDNKNYWN